MIRRLGLAAAATLVTLLVGEAVTRLSYDRLPSLAAMSDHELPAGDCADGVSPIVPSPSTSGVTVLGDSMVAGHDLGHEERLQFQLSDRLGADVRVDGRPGWGACGLLRRGLGTLEHPGQGTVLVFFTDDLDDHQVLRTDDGFAVAPTAASPAVRRVIEGSWLANRVWFAWRLRQGTASDRMVTPQGLAQLRAGVAQVEAAHRAQGRPLLVVLVEPLGMVDCPAQAEPDSRCARHREQGELLATELGGLDVELLDLRGLWTDADAQGLPREAGAELRIHPGTLGVERMAERLALAVGPWADG